MTTIGIPKSLFYYYQYPLWFKFFKTLGFDCIPSQDTNKKIVDMGVKKTVEEACLPVKVYFGHVLNLKESVDFIFIPRIISVEQKTFICPKFMGLPDMVKSIKIIPEEKILMPKINLRIDKKNLYEEFYKMGKKLHRSKKDIKNALDTAINFQKKWQKFCQENELLPDEAFKSLVEGKKVESSKSKQEKIAVLGHGYNIYDEYTSMGIIKKISHRYKVVTADMLGKDIIEKNVSHLPKKIFWSLGKKILGASNYFMNAEDVKGIIFIASFGCGPDSLVGDLVERYLHRYGDKPFMFLTIDEHTGEAGILTRLEAFLDMVERRKAI